jgi:Flp pilus assembly protein TadG
MCGSDDRGQTIPLVAIGLVLLAAMAYGLVAVGSILLDRAVARTAADAAALEMVVTDDEGAAREVAAANGAELLSVRWEGSSVEVEVRVGPVTARARASGSWSWVPPGGARHRGAIP